MEIKTEKWNKAAGYVVSVIFAAAMVAAGQLSGQMEIIFPEILALLTGFLMAEAVPWKVSGLSAVLLLTICASAGIVIVNFMEEGLLWQVSAAYWVVFVVLLAAGSTFLPCISACILPVLMGTESIVYPVSVFVMTVMIVGIRMHMEKHGIKSVGKHAGRDSGVDSDVNKEADNVNTNEKCKIMYDDAADKKYKNCADTNAEQSDVLGGDLLTKHILEWLKMSAFGSRFPQWILCFVVLLVLGAAAVGSGYRFLIAPPLVVVLVTFATPGNMQKKKPLQFYLITVACGVFGAGSLLIINGLMGLSPMAAVFAGTVPVAVMFYISGRLFPPAAALSLLPYIIPEESLMIYPVLIAVGGAVAIAGGMLVEKIISRNK